MKAVQRQIGLVLLLSSFALAQEVPATLRDVKVTSGKSGVQIEVTLSAPVRPSILATSDPFRLVMDFADTTPATQQRAGVNVMGVRAVRYALYQASPPITRVVVDLDQAHPYELRSQGDRVTLIVSAPVAAGVAQRHVPASAASGGLSWSLPAAQPISSNPLSRRRFESPISSGPGFFGSDRGPSRSW